MEENDGVSKAVPDADAPPERDGVEVEANVGILLAETDAVILCVGEVLIVTDMEVEMVVVADIENVADIVLEIVELDIDVLDIVCVAADVGVADKLAWFKIIGSCGGNATAR